MNKWEKMVKAVDAARKIKVALFDVDGVLFPAEVTVGTPTIQKSRAYYDGQGVSWLRAMGIHVAFITNEKDAHAAPVLEVTKKWNALPSNRSLSNKLGWSRVIAYTGSGGKEKITAAEHFLAQHGCNFKRASFMGDDIVDLPIMRKVVFPAAPAQAEECVIDLALLVTPRSGGRGAIRDFAEFVAAAQGYDLEKLPFS